MSFEIGKRITIPANTELNRGLCGDSDSIQFETPMFAEIVGPLTHGALPILLLGHEDLQPLYMFQPVEILHSLFGRHAFSES